MSKSDTWEYDVLQMLFYGNNSTMGLMTNAGTTTLWVGVHTADPGDAASTASEGQYSAYERSSVDRSSDAAIGWTDTSEPGAGAAGVSPLGNVDFPAVTTAGAQTLTHASVWT